MTHAENYDNYKKSGEGLKRYDPDSIDEDTNTEQLINTNKMKSIKLGKKYGLLNFWNKYFYNMNLVCILNKLNLKQKTK